MNEGDAQSGACDALQNANVVPFYSVEDRIRQLLKENQKMRGTMHYLSAQSDARKAAQERINSNNAVIRELRDKVSISVRKMVQEQ